MDVFCGIDWAEDHYDIALVDRDGKLLARHRISDDAGGLAQLLDLLAEMAPLQMGCVDISLAGHPRHTGARPGHAPRLVGQES